jgi:hypothetical protein
MIFRGRFCKLSYLHRCCQTTVTSESHNWYSVPESWLRWKCWSSFGNTRDVLFASDERLHTHTCGTFRQINCRSVRTSSQLCALCMNQFKWLLITEIYSDLLAETQHLVRHNVRSRIIKVSIIDFGTYDCRSHLVGFVSGHMYTSPLLLFNFAWIFSRWTLLVPNYYTHNVDSFLQPTVCL